MSDLYQVTAPHFCAGIVVLRGRIVEAAPILSWALRRSLYGFQAYCSNKGWKVVRVDGNETQT